MTAPSCSIRLHFIQDIDVKVLSLTDCLYVCSVCVFTCVLYYSTYSVQSLLCDIFSISVSSLSPPPPHTGEWITGGVCMYLARYLVTEGGKEGSRVASILKDLEFAIIPIVNPDGIAVHICT